MELAKGLARAVQRLRRSERVVRRPAVFLVLELGLSGCDFALGGGYDNSGWSGYDAPPPQDPLVLPPVTLAPNGKTAKNAAIADKWLADEYDYGGEKFKLGERINWWSSSIATPGYAPIPCAGSASWPTGLPPSRSSTKSRASVASIRSLHLISVLFDESVATVAQILRTVRRAGFSARMYRPGQQGSTGRLATM